MTIGAHVMVVNAASDRHQQIGVVTAMRGHKVLVRFSDGGVELFSDVELQVLR